MRLIERMLLELNSNYDGDAWHGTPLRLMVAEVDERTAHLRPAAELKTIAEMLAHITAWIGIVQRRLAGERFEVTTEMDFPSIKGTSWSEQLQQLDAAHTLLIDTVARTPEDALDQRTAGKEYTNEFMLQGLISHNAYHAGQIALVKKMLATTKA
jgi:uncharacterized damage-inducible protein DinB